MLLLLLLLRRCRVAGRVYETVQFFYILGGKESGRGGESNLKYCC